MLKDIMSCLGGGMIGVIIRFRIVGMLFVGLVNDMSLWLYAYGDGLWCVMCELGGGGI